MKNSKVWYYVLYVPVVLSLIILSIVCIQLSGGI